MEINERHIRTPKLGRKRADKNEVCDASLGFATGQRGRHATRNRNLDWKNMFSLVRRRVEGENQFLILLL